MTMHTSKEVGLPIVFIPEVGFLPNCHADVADMVQLLLRPVGIAPLSSNQMTSLQVLTRMIVAKTYRTKVDD